MFPLPPGEGLGWGRSLVAFIPPQAEYPRCGHEGATDPPFSNETPTLSVTLRLTTHHLHIKMYPPLSFSIPHSQFTFPHTPSTKYRSPFDAFIRISFSGAYISELYHSLAFSTLSNCSTTIRFGS